MTHLTKLIIAAIGMIPKGKVATYGQIAEIVHHKGSARQVSWTLRSQTKKYDLPWHRVINSKGKISLSGEDGLKQKEMLSNEGVLVNQDMFVDLEQFRWYPTPEEIIRIEKEAY